MRPLPGPAVRLPGRLGQRVGESLEILLGGRDDGKTLPVGFTGVEDLLVAKRRVASHDHLAKAPQQHRKELGQVALHLLGGGLIGGQLGNDRLLCVLLPPPV